MQAVPTSGRYLPQLLQHPVKVSFPSDIVPTHVQCHKPSTLQVLLFVGNASSTDDTQIVEDASLSVSRSTQPSE